MTLGGKIRHFRTIKGYTQENMANELGISTTAYGAIERDNSDISYSRLEMITNVLSVPAWILLSFGDRGYTYFNGSFQTYIVDSQIGQDQNLLHNQKDLMYELDKAKLIIASLEKELLLKDDLIHTLKSK